VLALLQERGVAIALSGLDRLVAACAMGDTTLARGIAAAEPALVDQLKTMGGTLLARFAGTDNAPGVACLLDLGLDVAAPFIEGDGYFDIAPYSLAMHVAAANPQALDSASLDPAVVQREKDVLADKYRQQGKPENMIEKIVESGLKTYYKEVCLMDQAFIHDEKGKSVAQAVKEAEGKIGAPVKITGFVRYALGEGIDKQESDFAAEVAAASGQKKPPEDPETKS